MRAVNRVCDYVQRWLVRQWIVFLHWNMERLCLRGLFDLSMSAMSVSNAIVCPLGSSRLVHCRLMAIATIMERRINWEFARYSFPLFVFRLIQHVATLF